jgi:hypothetical protein
MSSTPRDDFQGRRNTGQVYTLQIPTGCTLEPVPQANSVTGLEGDIPESAFCEMIVKVTRINLC